jgi:predicted transcriptional regulator
MPDKTVAEAMNRRPVVLAASTRAEEARRLARRRKLHHLLVRAEDGALSVVCLCDLLDRDPLDDGPPVREADVETLSTYVRARTFVTSPDDSLEAALAVMKREGIGCLPVESAGELVGLLTRRDCLP